MSDEEDRHTLSIQLANQIINLANNRLQDGLSAVEIASGMRHAAANFTAFTVANAVGGEDIDPEMFADEFLQVYDYYLKRHRQSAQPRNGLEALIKQVRDES